MSEERPTSLGALARGLAAGAIGTAAMTLHQELHAKLRSADSQASSDKTEDEQRDPWESAPAPARVGKRILEGIFDQRVPPERIGLLTQVMHWAYGIGWGAAFGLIAGTTRSHPVKLGLPFGAGVWAASYAELVPMGIYEPPWNYPAKTLAGDLGYHLTYGIAVAAGYAAIDHSV